MAKYVDSFLRNIATNEIFIGPKQTAEGASYDLLGDGASDGYATSNILSSLGIDASDNVVYLPCFNDLSRVYDTITLFYSIAWAKCSSIELRLWGCAELDIDSADWHRITTTSTSSGTITVSNGTYTKSVSTDDSMVVNVDVTGLRWLAVECGATGDGEPIDWLYLKATGTRTI